MRPLSLDPEHFRELVSCSGIDCKLAALNFISLTADAVVDRLWISPAMCSAGMRHGSWLRRHAFIAAGGWWCSGLDPLKNWREMKWGCYKPNRPRLNKKGKSIKYEHPPKTPTRVFCLRVPLHVWQQVSRRYNVAMPENIAIAETGEALGFWQWVVAEKIPVIICEGAKKAAALLSQGYVAIALPGISNGYRSSKDFQGNVICRQLIPEFLPFTEKVRTFYICFDYETKPKTLRAVNNAIAQLGKLLIDKSCSVKVIRLPGIEKGVDDFIVERGAAAFELVYQASADYETDIAKTKPHTELSYAIALTINRPYLENLPFPASGLVAVKSAKGTGKTTALLPLVEAAKKRGQPILLLTHRIQLGQFLCEKIGVKWGIGHGNHRRDAETSYRCEEIRQPLPMPQTRSLGLCIDSIWKLNPSQWQGAIVILDEVEQCLWHLLNSNTCKEKRVLILRVFQQLISTVLQTGGLVIAQDADLSNLSLDYLKGLSGIEISPWVAVNEWQCDRGWDVTFYDTPNPTLLIQQLEVDLIAGKKCYVTTDSRSGRYSCETIDRYIKQRLEQLLHKYPKTLVVSSQTTRTSGHDAVNFVEDINKKALEYDAVFVTPSLGTGVSIDGEHFDRVYGIFQGVIPDWEARQALARVRANIPRFIWCAKRGIGSIGCGSKNYRVLSEWYQENHKENLALMSPLYKVDVDLPFICDPIHLRIWAKLAARVNGSIALYRQSMLEGLMGEKHRVNVISDASPTDIVRDLRMALLATNSADIEIRKNLVLQIVKVQKEFSERSQKSKSVKKQIKRIRTQAEFQSACAVACALDIGHKEYDRLLGKRSLTDEEQHQIDKYILRQRYGVEVTPQLKLRDDKGYYSQLLLHYYLTHESEYFRIRDFQEWHLQLYRGEGKVFLPDINVYTLKVEALLALGVQQFLEPEREFRQTDADLIRLKETAFRYSKQIKKTIGITMPMETEISPVSSIKIANKLLSLLGLKLEYFKVDEVQGNQTKAYRIAPEILHDGREEIFQLWHKRDTLILETLSQRRLDLESRSHFGVSVR
ncbi:plasmid replication protein, CyRepA1 family [Aerosakkonema sp. BLCC-F183]|uniref:plasmid replication protein, CyRepA1 family n=1 Tax=Aerosakkonema sp. BLCC-F183 TaxID=3342834 RepID=UPI0035B703B2